MPTGRPSRSSSRPATWAPGRPPTRSRRSAGPGRRTRNTNGHYVNVVKAIKWWRRLNAAPPYPKGYPLEHLIGISCPDGIASVAEGVVRTLEDIRDR